MIPRYQRVLFWGLSAAILLMGLFMLRGCAQAREKLTRRMDETPLDAPVAAPTQTVHLAVADDATGAIVMEDRELALPEEPTARVRALLGRLLAEYTYKGSKHPIESGPAVDDVFLLDLPLRPAVAQGGSPHGPREVAAAGAQEDGGSAEPFSPGAQLAVINLHGGFADHHPSGIEAETLTIQSILGTLYANMPQIEQVRFLVDGQPRETLNGHADLMHVYQVKDAATGTAVVAQGMDR